MGCWNATCAITNLPILAYEHIRVMFLVKGKTLGVPGSIHYATDLYNILPFFVTGQYNDYGAIEEGTEKGRALSVLYKVLRVNSIKELFDKAHESQLTVEGLEFSLNHNNDIIPNYKATKYVLPVMMKESAFQSVLANYKIDSWDKDVDGKSYGDFASGVVSAVVDRFNDKKKDDILYDFDDRLLKSEDPGLIGIGQSFAYFGAQNLETKIKWFFRDHPDCVKEIAEDAFEMFWFNVWVNRARMSFVPQLAGSQDVNTDPQRLRANIVLEEIKKIEEYYDN